MKYPPPAYALQCWFADGHIRVAIPGSTPEGKGHIVDLDMDADGVKTLMFLLKQRIAIRDTRIGHEGVPTQAMIDALQHKIKNPDQIKITTVVKTTVKKSVKEINLEDLGL